MVPSGHHCNERYLFFCFWLHCASLASFLSPLTLFLKFTHTHTPPSISVSSMKFWWTYQRSTVLVAEGQFKCVTQSSVSEREKMFCYRNQNILYTDNGRNTPWKIGISLVLLLQIALKFYLILLFVSLEGQTWAASPIAIREERIGLEKREYFGFSGFFSRPITLLIIF